MLGKEKGGKSLLLYGRENRSCVLASWEGGKEKRGVSRDPNHGKGRKKEQWKKTVPLFFADFGGERKGSASLLERI